MARKNLQLFISTYIVESKQVKTPEYSFEKWFLKSDCSFSFVFSLQKPNHPHVPTFSRWYRSSWMSLNLIPGADSGSQRQVKNRGKPTKIKQSTTTKVTGANTHKKTHCMVHATITTGKANQTTQGLKIQRPNPICPTKRGYSPGPLYLMGPKSIVTSANS